MQGALATDELDALVNQAKMTLDASRRAEIIDEIVGIVNSLSPQITLYQSHGSVPMTRIWTEFFVVRPVMPTSAICTGSKF
ncbi:MAG: hypothetical protein ACLSHJ_04145 [Oscillospiraceae bacterium]